MFGKKKTTVAAGSDLDLDLGLDLESQKSPDHPASEKPSAKAGKADSVASRAMESAALRYDYYRDSFRKAWALIFGLAAALALSIILNIVQYSKDRTPLPIAVTPDGRVMAITPLDREGPLGNEGVADWAARVVPSLYRLNFTEYRDQLADREGMFTEAGYRGYLDAIDRMNMVDLIKANNYLVHAAPREAPQIVDTGKLKGAKLWVVKAPILVTFDNGTNPTTQTLTVTAWIVRVPETANPLGLAIQSFSAARG